MYKMSVVKKCVPSFVPKGLAEFSGKVLIIFVRRKIKMEFGRSFIPFHSMLTHSTLENMWLLVALPVSILCILISSYYFFPAKKNVTGKHKRISIVNLPLTQLQNETKRCFQQVEFQPLSALSAILEQMGQLEKAIESTRNQKLQIGRLLGDLFVL